MKKVLRISGWILLLGAIVTVGILVQSSHRKLIAENPLITIVPDHVGFVDEGDIEFAIINAGLEIEGEYLDSVRTGSIETVLLEMPHVLAAEVYKTIDGQLYIDVAQREPVARIIRDDGLSCYLDQGGEVMKLSNKHTAHVVVFTGMIPDPVMDWSVQDANEGDSLGGDYLLDDIFEVATFIDNNEFWRAQIQQVYVNENHELELIPRVGSHRIMLGKAEGLAEKFEKLMVFYEQGLGKANWNIYDTISLEFANQVVCSKR